MIGADNVHFGQRRFTNGCRTMLVDTVRELGGEGAGSPIKIVFSIAKKKCFGTRGKFIEQGRMRITFEHSSDGLPELKGRAKQRRRAYTRQFE